MAVLWGDTCNLHLRPQEGSSPPQGWFPVDSGAEPREPQEPRAVGAEPREPRRRGVWPVPISLPSAPQFSFLMTEALLIFSPETSLLRSFSRKVRVRAHWALQLLALLCALLGLGIITYNKHLNGKGHFVTWHGLTGLLAVLYAGGQCAGGVLLLYPKLMKNWTLAKLKLYHATSGLVGYLLGCASLMLGMCSLWFTTTVTGASWYLAMLCPLVTSLVIMNQVSNAYLYRKRSQH
ncbi:cytochrome b561 domain-containing protein 2 [Cyanistes caeruleus]|uniref:cytochrome b561 domain-containing protein 2 n=1 Tax=Cyanistes caeruleus TaxID=156563 RepID=UPI000CDB10DF|nr:cytochrome b561 domain-containing protein 2 [Cyanistes caeruleus]